MCFVMPTVISSLVPCALQVTLAGMNVLPPLHVWGTPLHLLNSAWVSLLWQYLTVPPLVRVNYFLPQTLSLGLHI